ncbi:hypothetical protein E2C01_102221 [Portunus trituberculatus]|uniref:Uncharacterized protein n=1 Tax=Portunus trituberculatus TaxID=210409 RepID=A0A5B7KHZ3_PORTR|nr:hypothetical protein [Portunus trituberculatus]
MEGDWGRNRAPDTAGGDEDALVVLGGKGSTGEVEGAGLSQDFFGSTFRQGLLCAVIDFELRSTSGADD